MIGNVKSAVGIHKGGREGDLKFRAVVRRRQNRLDHGVEFREIPIGGLLRVGVRLHGDGLREALETDVLRAKHVELRGFRGRMILEELIVPFCGLKRSEEHTSEIQSPDTISYA